MTIEIVDFPIKNDGLFHSYVTVYQRVKFIDHLRSSGSMASLKQTPGLSVRLPITDEKHGLLTLEVKYKTKTGTGGLEHLIFFSIIYGMSSFPLTNSYFFKMVKTTNQNMIRQL